MRIRPHPPQRRGKPCGRAGSQGAPTWSTPSPRRQSTGEHCGGQGSAATSAQGGRRERTGQKEARSTSGTARRCPTASHPREGRGRQRPQQQVRSASRSASKRSQRLPPGCWPPLRWPPPLRGLSQGPRRSRARRAAAEVRAKSAPPPSPGELARRARAERGAARQRKAEAARPEAGAGHPGAGQAEYIHLRAKTPPAPAAVKQEERAAEEPPAAAARAGGQTYRALARRVEFQRTGSGPPRRRRAAQRRGPPGRRHQLLTLGLAESHSRSQRGGPTASRCPNQEVGCPLRGSRVGPAGSRSGRSPLVTARRRTRSGLADRHVLPRP